MLEVIEVKSEFLSYYEITQVVQLLVNLALYLALYIYVVFNYRDSFDLYTLYIVDEILQSIQPQVTKTKVLYLSRYFTCLIQGLAIIASNKGSLELLRSVFKYKLVVSLFQNVEQYTIRPSQQRNLRSGILIDPFFIQSSKQD